MGKHIDHRLVHDLNRTIRFRLIVLSVQKVLSGSGRAGRLRLMGQYIGHRLVAQPELDNTFWTDSTIVPKGIVRFRSCNKAVVNVFPHKAEPSCATRTGQYLFGR